MASIKPKSTALSVILVASLGACASTSTPTATLTDEENAIQQAVADAMKPATAEEISLAERSDPLTRANFWADEYRKDAGNEDTTISFLRALRGLGSHDRVLEVAGKALPTHPKSSGIYLEVGRSLMAQNKTNEAAEAFAIATDLAPASDAAPLAALGLAFDQLGQHEKAQETYQMALDRAPQRVSTLNNYGLSLALTGHIDTAETVLRYAVNLPDANARVRQNLALVLGLQGKYEEMQSVDPNAPRRTIDANRKALQQMMTPSRTYEELQAYSAESVLDDLKPEVEKMPELRHAEIEEEPLAEPAGELLTDGSKPVEAAPVSPPLRLKPRLRDRQGG